MIRAAAADRIGLFIWLQMLALAVIRASFLPEPDIFWEARAGLDSIDTGRLPSHDIWNWLLHAAPWTPNSWGWDMLLAFTWRLGGMIGLAAFTALTTFVVLLLLWLLIRRLSLPSAQAWLIWLLAASTFLPWLSARPQLADYLILLIYILWVASSHRIWLLISASFLLSILWMNLHLTGTAMPLLFVTVYWLQTQLSGARRWLTGGAVLIVSSLGLLLNPYSLGGVTKGAEVAQASIGIVPEWSPPQLTDVHLWLGIIVFGLGGLALAWRRRQLAYGTAVLLLLVLSVAFTRFIPYLALITLSGALRQLPLAFDLPALLTRALRGLRAVLTILLVGAALVMLLVRLINPAGITREDLRDFQQLPQGAHVLTTPNFGSEIDLLRPDASASADGRNDLIPRSLYRQELEVLFYLHGQAATSAWLTQHGVTAVLISSPDDSYLRSRLNPAQWHRQQLPDAVLYTRQGVG